MAEILNPPVLISRPTSPDVPALPALAENATPNDILRTLANTLRPRRDPPRTETRKITDFKGTETAEQAEDWMRELELYFNNKHVTRSSEKINTALSYIVGEAAPFTHRIRQER